MTRGTPLGSFLLPDGYSRPGMGAVLREAGVVGEAGRLALVTAGCTVGAVTSRVRRTPGAAGSAEPVDLPPVVLVPGFLAGDSSLLALSRTLRSRGFRTYRSHILANVRCTSDATDRLEARVEQVAERRGSPVQVVGHSLGGMLARGLAARRPDLVAGIVTMGSPMRAPAAHHLVLTAGVGVLVGLSRAGVPRLMAGDCVGGDCARRSFEESCAPLHPRVGFTALYSRRDGIVDWRACLDDQAEPVEVSATHLGMAVDPRVAREVVRALRRHAARETGLRSVDPGGLRTA